MSWNPFTNLSNQIASFRNDMLVGFSLLNQKVESMANSVDAAITKLQGDVTGLTTVVTSAETLINGFAAQLAAAVAAAQRLGQLQPNCNPSPTCPRRLSRRAAWTCCGRRCKHADAANAVTDPCQAAGVQGVRLAPRIY